MTQVISRVHSVHLMNIEQCQVAADPETKPTDLGCESACRLLYDLHPSITIYYYSPQKPILILSSHRG